MTAERFVPNPYSRKEGERVYRTGDLVRWRAGGELEFVGRVDEQVKIRGHRIEPGEVEGVLREHEGVKEAVVVVREEERGEKRLVGYVVWKEGKEGGGRELRNYLKERLPEYMVPGLVVELEGLPLTANGKVDRKGLPAPEVRSQRSEYAGPRTPVEEMLVEIWQEVLHVERVGIHDDFFELGGDSLLVTRILAQIREKLKVEVAVRMIFELPTVLELESDWKSWSGEEEGWSFRRCGGMEEGEAGRCRMRRSGCGFWSRWGWRERPTTCRWRFGWQGDWTKERWGGVLSGWWRDMRACERGLDGKEERKCR